MMKDDEITVIVQGAIDPILTKRCIASIRNFLPSAEIILSTWENSKIKGFTADKILFNKDPGNIEDNITKQQDNTNREILSTYNGLTNSSPNRKFAIKIRSDAEITSNNFLRIFDSYPNRDKIYSIFESKIIISTLFTKQYLDASSKIPTPFHISDWFQFGLKQDLIKLWDIPLINRNSDFISYNKEIMKCYKDLWTPIRLAPEQYIFLECVKKNFRTLTFNSLIEFNSNIIDLSDKLIANNFIIKNPLNVGFQVLKQPYFDYINNLGPILDDAIITEELFNSLYLNYTK